MTPLFEFSCGQAKEAVMLSALEGTAKAGINDGFGVASSHGGFVGCVLFQVVNDPVGRFEAGSRIDLL